MLCAGTSGQDNITVTMLRASTKLFKDWRQRLRAQSGDNPEEGHPRAWLVGDAIHAMQPNRQVGSRWTSENVLTTEKGNGREPSDARHCQHIA